MSKKSADEAKNEPPPTPEEHRVDPVSVFGDPVKRESEIKLVREQRSDLARRILVLMEQFLKRCSERDRAVSPEVGDHAVSAAMKPLEHAKMTYRNLGLYEDALLASRETDSVLVVASAVVK